MRILSINVKAGGLRAQIDTLLQRALNHNADVYVVTEFRDTSTGARIRATLRQNGCDSQAYSRAHRGNGVLVAARWRFHAVYNPAGLPEESYPNALIECIFNDLHIVGAYLPGQDRKRPHFEYLIRFAQAMDAQEKAAMIIGDLNSGRNETDIEANLGKNRLADEFSTAGQYRLLEQHWKEAWLYKHPNEVEFSWYPRAGVPQRKNGWRLDKAFVSAALLPRVRDAFYDHEFRLQGLTDHSALIVDLERTQ
jgi:exodeoxyribonuclease III